MQTMFFLKCALMQNQTTSSLQQIFKAEVPQIWEELLSKEKVLLTCETSRKLQLACYVYIYI